ncbi:hypothetical protein M0802_003178 [Mischocyttarus mexicanus]|nr:hypothetical protein M0802_003178 [Mischocyttarus mexicanus]
MILCRNSLLDVVVVVVVVVVFTIVIAMRRAQRRGRDENCLTDNRRKWSINGAAMCAPFSFPYDDDDDDDD